MSVDHTEEAEQKQKQKQSSSNSSRFITTFQSNSKNASKSLKAKQEDAIQDETEAMCD